MHPNYIHKNYIKRTRVLTTTTSSSEDKFNAVNYWLENVGSIKNKRKQEIIEELAEQYGEEAFREAIDIAVMADKTRVDYVRGVLRRRSSESRAGNEGSGSTEADGIWQRARDVILERIGKEEWESWIAGIRCLGLRGNVLLLEISGMYRRDWVEREYGEMLREAIREQRQDLELQWEWNWSGSSERCVSGEL